MNRYKQFTHTDFDGVSCAILSQIAFDSVEVEYCDYDNVNEKIQKFIESKDYLNYSRIYITDISINKELAEVINNLKDEINIKLIDHHETALYLNKYDWCTVTTSNDRGPTCGTTLFYDYLINLKNTMLDNDWIRDFVETVRQYDTWEWKNVYHNDKPKLWNNLLYLYGRDLFIDHICGMLIYCKTFAFTDTDNLLLKLEEKKKEEYFKKKSEEMDANYYLLGYHVGVVFAEQYISELGNFLAEGNKQLDFIVIISGKTISYRTIKKDINLGKIAEKFGGGGHPASAGSQISLDKQVKYCSILFE
jgi:oligoribonuclease NrnB/cAMP/cGMP phosphodiesterase (DHH superfamily)